MKLNSHVRMFFFLFLFLMCTGVKAGTINGYTTNVINIDWSAGSDLTGTGTKANPIKTHPYMPNFAGVYIHAAGDRFIFKGKVTWPQQCYPWEPQAGGLPSTPDYYGVDQTWFIGGAGGGWDRPRFNGNHGVEAGIYDAGYQNITFDSLDIFGLKITNVNNACICGINWSNIIVTNCWLHDWVSGSTFDKPCGGFSGQYNGSVVINNVRLLGCIVENQTNGPPGLWNGELIHGAGVISNCLVYSNSSAIVFAQDVNQCVIHDIEYPYAGYDQSGSVHFNGFYMDNGAGNASLSSGVPIYFRNSYFYNAGGGANMAYPNIEKEDCYIYNDVFYGVQTAQLPINIDPYDFGATPGTVNSCHVWNVTVTNYANNSVAIHYSVRAGVNANILDFQNNHIMGVGATLTDANSGDCITLIENNNLIQNPTGSPFYSLATVYAPQSPVAQTVGQGANLNAFFTTSISNTVRGLHWDIGAYQYLGAIIPQTDAIFFGGNTMIQFGGNTVITP